MTSQASAFLMTRSAGAVHSYARDALRWYYFGEDVLFCARDAAA